MTDIDEVDIEFAKTTNRIKEVLCKHKTDVVSLVEKLCAVSAVKRKGVPLFDRNVFQEVTSINELWKKLKDYWNIYDYDLLIILVKLTECKEAQETLDGFLDKIDPFAIKDVDLVLYFRVYDDEGLMRPQLRIKVNTEKFTADIERIVKQTISVKFNLENYSLRLKAIKEGCIQFIYHISKAVMSYLLEFQVTGSIMADIGAQNIISLQLNDMILNVPSEVCNMVRITLWTVIGLYIPFMYIQYVICTHVKESGSVHIL